MKIVVCVKQVPSSSEVRLDPVTHTIVRDGRQSVLNPFDLYALALAVELNASLGGEVVALSMGIPQTEALLRDAIARGVDRAVLLSDRAFAGADTLATSYALACGIQRLGGADLILCGKMAVDGDTAQIGPELAEQLQLPHVTDVQSISSLSHDTATVERVSECGVDTLRVPLPAVLCVNKDIAQPQMPSIAGVRRSLCAQVDVWTAQDVQADPARIGLLGSPTQVVGTDVPERTHRATYWHGTAQELAAKLYEEVRA